MIPVNLEREENLFLEADKELLVCFCHCLITLSMLLFKSKTILYISRKQFLLYQHANPHKGKLLKSSLNFNSRIYSD